MSLYFIMGFFLFCYLLRSGTGKSTLLKKLVGLSNSDIKGGLENIKQVYLLNVGGAEKKVYSKLSDKDVHVLEGYDKLVHTKNRSLLLVEDIINMSKSEERLLRKTLNYDAHHKKQKVFCVSHSIHKTSIWSLLAFFHFIIFTSASSNIPVIRFTLNYFKIEKSQIDSWLSQFQILGRAGKFGIYFYFDCVKMTFNVANNTTFSNTKLLGTAGLAESASPAGKQDSDPNLKTQLQVKFAAMIEAFAHKSQANAIFSMIVNCLNPTLIREHDLSFAFKSLKTNREIRFSLVDYITVLLTPHCPVSRPLEAFHNYIQSICRLPLIFCVNKKMLPSSPP